MALPCKRRALSYSDKMKIIKYFDKKSKNYKKTQIAEELGIAMSTLSTILKYRKATEETCKSYSGRNLKRKKNKSGKFTELEDILIDWIHSMSSQETPPNGPLIKKRALEIANDLGIPDFAGSNGWLERFKKRHGIALRHIEDPNSDAEDGSISSLDTNYQDILKNYDPSDTFNADEFGLFYRLMPEEEVADKKCEDGALASERLTILACVNSNGTEKLPLLIIGNAGAPTTNLPCQYTVEPHSWMTKDIFVNWLKVLDDYFEIQGRLIVLLVDSSPLHPKEIVLNNINLVILPSDLEYEMPMTQGVVKTLKQNYRMKLIEMFQADEEISTSRKTFSFMEALKQICCAWDAVKPGTVQSSFQKSGFGDYYDIDDDDHEYKADLCMKYNDYMCVDYEVATCQQGNNFNPETIVTDDNLEDVEMSTKGEDKNARKLSSNKAVATAVTSIANLRQYLNSINSQDGLEKLIYIENIVSESIANINVQRNL